MSALPGLYSKGVARSRSFDVSYAIEEKIKKKNPSHNPFLNVGWWFACFYDTESYASGSVNSW